MLPASAARTNRVRGGAGHRLIQRSFDGEMAVAVDEQIDFRADSLPHRDYAVDSLRCFRGRIKVTGHTVERGQLDGIETLADGHSRAGGKTLGRTVCRRPVDIGIEPELVPYLAAEQRVNWHACRFSRYVPHGLFDGAAGVNIRAMVAVSRPLRVKRVDTRGIPAHKPFTEFPQRRHLRLVICAREHFSNTPNSCVCEDVDEDPLTSVVHVDGVELDMGNAHTLLSVWCATRRRNPKISNLAPR